MSSNQFFDAIEKNDSAALKKILSEPININQKDFVNASGLHRAIVHKSAVIAHLLIHAGIDLNLRDEQGKTALHYTAEYNQYETAKLILEKEGNLSLADVYGNEPLWTAVFNVKGKLERLPIVELFLLRAADKNHKNNAGRSPSDFANQVQFSPLIELLQKY